MKPQTNSTLKKYQIYLIICLFLTQVALSQEDSKPENTIPPSVGNKNAPALPPEKQNPVEITYFETPPSIDGVIDEEIWQSAAVLKDFYETQPGDNDSPTFPTDVLIGYDSKNLYLAVKATDTSGSLRATIPRRDDIFADDHVIFYLDTFHDKQRAYILAFSPLGIQQDGLFNEATGEDYSVDIVMTSKGVVSENGYTIEVAIPFKSFRFASGKDNPWGIHIIRRKKNPNNEQNSWMPLDRTKSGFLNQEGRINGFDRIGKEKTLELIPSIVAAQTGRRVRPTPVGPVNPVVDTGRIVNEGINTDIGLTAKFVPSPDFTIDLAINPDFAQVEADQPVITANQRFPIFFPERRPFFLERIDVFNTPLSILNTRVIVDPEVALKFTGQKDRNTFGMLVALDKAPGNFSEDERNDPDLLPFIERFIDKKAFIGVGRFSRDFGKENNIGVIASTYNFVEENNHVAAIDGRFRLDKKTTFRFQVAGTHTRRGFGAIEPDIRTLNGFGYQYRYQIDGRNFGLVFTGAGRTRNFVADVGFVRRTDTNNSELALSYLSNPKKDSVLISWELLNLSQTNFDWNGSSQFFNNNSQMRLNFQKEGLIGFGYQRGFERLFEKEFGGPGNFLGPDNERSTNRNVYYIFGGVTPSKKISVYAEINYFDGAFDFDFGAGPKFPRVSPAALLDPNALLDPGAGKEFLFYSQIIYQPTDSLRFTLDYTKNKLERKDTKKLAFDENLFTFRASYQFTKFLFTRAKIDYSVLNSRLDGQYLFGWNPNPGTAVFLGYNDNSSINGFSPITQQREPGFVQNSRTFFVKFSYLFRYNF